MNFVYINDYWPTLIPVKESAKMMLPFKKTFIIRTLKA